MKVEALLKLFLIIFFFAGVVAVGSYFSPSFLTNSNNPKNISSDKLFGWKFPTDKFPLKEPVRSQVSFSEIRDQDSVPRGLPVRLKIPTIGVDSVIEDAFITPDGRMDVPAGSVNVAWFALGPRPGQVGSAVIGGHFGIDRGTPKVFYNLNKLETGDKVYIVDDKGVTSGFVVRSISVFDRNADATSVFTSNDGLAHLNLITCEGIWNQVNDSYPSRRVVFTDAIPMEDAVDTQSEIVPETTLTPIPEVSVINELITSFPFLSGIFEVLKITGQ